LKNPRLVDAGDHRCRVSEFGARVCLHLRVHATNNRLSPRIPGQRDSVREETTGNSKIVFLISNVHLGKNTRAFANVRVFLIFRTY
jgi:hypothetical protein